MSLLRFRGKVRLISEDAMEMEGMDMGIISKSSEWVWKDVAIPIEQVYKLISYNSSLSIIQLYDDERILVKERFDSLYDRWKIARADIPEDTVEEEEENNQVDETLNEEDED